MPNIDHYLACHGVANPGGRPRQFDVHEAWPVHVASHGTRLETTHTDDDDEHNERVPRRVPNTWFKNEHDNHEHGPNNFDTHRMYDIRGTLTDLLNNSWLEWAFDCRRPYLSTAPDEEKMPRALRLLLLHRASGSSRGTSTHTLRAQHSNDEYVTTRDPATLRRPVAHDRFTHNRRTRIRTTAMAINGSTPQLSPPDDHGRRAPQAHTPTFTQPQSPPQKTRCKRA